MRKIPLFLLILLLFSFSLQACGKSILPMSPEEEMKSIGQNIVTKLIVDYYEIKDEEEFEEKFIYGLYDESYVSESYARQSMHLSHKKVLLKFNKGEVHKIENESVEPTDEGGFIYKATVTDKMYYTEVKEDGQTYRFDKNDYEIHLNKDANGQHKISNISVEKQFYFPDISEITG
ncbi:hypothetical protein [Paenibacillus marinisediminis]